MLRVAFSRHRGAARFGSWKDTNLVVGMTLWIASCPACLHDYTECSTNAIFGYVYIDIANVGNPR